MNELSIITIKTILNSTLNGKNDFRMEEKGREGKEKSKITRKAKVGGREEYENDYG